jgi:Tfp pilus assembly protein PilN
MDFRKWLAFGTGVGVEVREQELRVTIVRVRRSATAVLGSATVTDYKGRPAAEWGGELSTFLRKLGAAHIAATILLPRQDVIVRTVQLPGVSDRDIEAAIRLQIDSLHPFSEDDVYFSWGRIGETSSILVGIARRERIEQLSSMFAEAGIKVASFSFSAAVIYAAIRLGAAAPPAGFVVVSPAEREIEVYGESPARPVFSATFPPIANRALALAKSELRLEPETEPSVFTDLLPKPAVFPADHDPNTTEFSSHAMPYATALAGACPWLSIDGNLLPIERRRGSSRVRLIPTFALGTILLVFLGALGAQSRWADSRYLGVLQHEVRRFEPQARKVDSLDKAVTATRARSQLLDEFRRRAQYDMEALTEITRLIPPPGWVASLEMDRQMLQIAGEADQAAGLLKTIDNSRLFERSEFTMPITRTPSGDAFRLKAVRTPNGVAVVPEPVSAGPASVPPTQQMQPGFIPAQPIPPGFQQAVPQPAPMRNAPLVPSQGGVR